MTKLTESCGNCTEIIDHVVKEFVHCKFKSYTLDGKEMEVTHDTDDYVLVRCPKCMSILRDE